MKSQQIEAIAEYLKVRDEALGTPEADDAERLQSATDISALSVPAAAVVGEPVAALQKLSLWFFRDLSGEQRGKLFGLFGMNDAQKDTNHGYQAMALKQVLRALAGDQGGAK